LEQSQGPNKKWYVVYTKPRNEQTAEYYLVRKGIEVFFPKLFLPVPNRRGRQLFPLFPNYLFVRVDVLTQEYACVLWSPGVKRFVSFGQKPTEVEQKIIDFMRRQATSDGMIVATPKFKVGDEVCVTGGPLKGLVGILQEPPDSKTRIKVLMSILNRQVHVEVPVKYIDIGWVAPEVTTASC
jgi:transcriptional antiterminator RfaH